MKTRQVLATSLAAGLSLAATPAHADEGMWLYSAPPREQIRAKYGFELTPAWLEHLMKSSIRFNSGGSGSFVSADGLVITNHHVASDDLQKISDEKNNYRLEVLLTAWSARREENARRARDDLFTFQNSRKVYDGQQAGLYSPAILGPKTAQEKAFLAQARDRADGAEVRAAFDRIAEAVSAQRKIYVRYRLLEGGHAFTGDSFGFARSLLRAGDERPKPNGERLKEFGDARRESFELGLFSTKPVYEDLEILLLTDALTLLADTVGFSDPLVTRVLAGQSPTERAAALIRGTRVRDVAFRRKLYDGGAAAVAAARDPLIELARLVDAEARALRQTWEAAEETRQQAHAVIEKSRFAIEGASRPPDATFTLRLSYGPVKGYVEGGRPVPAYTTYAGLYERNAEHKNKEPFGLPARWLEKKAALDLRTPFNFVHTPDIIGGNSGSPVVNTAGEFVGIIFDGNIQSLVADFVYDDAQSRAVSLDCRAIEINSHYLKPAFGAFCFFGDSNIVSDFELRASNLESRLTSVLP